MNTTENTPEIRYAVRPLHRVMYGAAKRMNPALQNAQAMAERRTAHAEQLLTEAFTGLYDPKASEAPSVSGATNAILETLETSAEWKRYQRICAGRRGLAGRVLASLAGPIVDAIPEVGDTDTPDAENDPALRSAIRRGFKAATPGADGAVEAHQAMTAILGTGPQAGTASAQLDEQVDALYDRLDPKQIALLASLAGHAMKSLRAKERSAKLRGHGNPIGITTGNTAIDLLPSEIALAAHPDLRPLFYAGYAERSLLQVEREQEQDQDQGPVIFCVDRSASMRGFEEAWANGLLLALGNRVRAEGRPFAVVHFNSRVERVSEHRTKHTSLVEDICVRSAGGTSFDEPLKAAGTLIVDGGFEGADVIFLTDGEDEFTDKYGWCAIAEEHAINVFGVGIGDYRARSMARFCDTVTGAETLSADAIADVVTQVTEG